MAWKHYKELDEFSKHIVDEALMYFSDSVVNICDHGLAWGGRYPCDCWHRYENSL